MNSDIRQKIIQSTLDMLELTDNPNNITIAGIVAVVGCTPPTLYNYWSTREQLLAEASEYGWQIFRDSLSKDINKTRDPLKRIMLRGQNYINFAISKPSLFRALFLTGNNNQSNNQPSPAFMDLMNDVAEAIHKGKIIKSDVLEMTLLIWSTVHGVAVMCVTSPIDYDMARRIADLQQRSILATITVK